MFHLFKKKKETVKAKSPTPTAPSPFELIFRKKMTQEEIDARVKELHDREEREAAEKRALSDKVLADLGYTRESLDEVKSDGYRRNYKDGVYHRNPQAKPGSIDNPREIGMEGCCNTLVFIAERGGWCLTDGLGNGWIR